MKKFIFKLFFSKLAIIIFSQGIVCADGMPEDLNRALKNKKEKKDVNIALSEHELRKFQYCGKDSDCIQVINGCCQCLQGDKYTAINKDRIKEFRSMFNCNIVTCPEDTHDHSCTEGLVSCINHRCHYFTNNDE